MSAMESMPEVYEGLVKDTDSGNYRVLPGYGPQVHRYRINETWLDEEDDVWIDGLAVEREGQKTEDRADDKP